MLSQIQHVLFASLLALSSQVAEPITQPTTTTRTILTTPISNLYNPNTAADTITFSAQTTITSSITTSSTTITTITPTSSEPVAPTTCVGGITPYVCNGIIPLCGGSSACACFNVVGTGATCMNINLASGCSPHLKCTTSDDCDSGYNCVTDTCCGFNVCTQADSRCDNLNAPAMMFRRRGRIDPERIGWRTGSGAPGYAVNMLGRPV